MPPSKVLIVGAGAIGLRIAQELLRRHVRVVIRVVLQSVACTYTPCIPVGFTFCILDQEGMVVYQSPATESSSREVVIDGANV